MRRYVAIAAGTGLIAAVLSVMGGLPALAQGALRPLAALIVNDSNNPVPVVTPAPKLQASAITMSGDAPVALPHGIVFTDFVISSGSPNCATASIGLFPNPIGAGNLVLRRADGEYTMQLHLTTGVRSTADEPLGVSVPFNCAATLFWSGYEG
jgi:hypothetical protein